MNNKIEKWFSLQKFESTEEQIRKREQAAVLYWEEIFPFVVDHITKKSMNYRGKYKKLISLVGFSPEPIILSILALKPEEVNFIYSPETKHQLDRIMEKCSLQLSRVEMEKVESSNVEEVYSVIKKFIKGYNPNDIAVDITGGKKSMVGGAAQAAAFLHCDALYVDYDEYHKEFRKPQPGTEYLNFLKNPFEIFGDLEMKRAMELYNNGNYAAAIEVVGRISNKAPESNEAEIKTAVFAMFRNWEDYQFESAIKYGKQAKAKINRFLIYRHLLDEIEIKLNLLQKIVDNDQRWIIINHYFMAASYSNRKKYDFAVLLLYRTLEQLLAYRLSDKYNLDVSDADYAAHPDILEQYNSLLPKIYGGQARISNEMPARLGVMAAAAVLTIFDDELMENVNLQEIREQADNRNQGILAHGSKANTEKQYRSMERVFLPVIKQFVDIYFERESLGELLERFKRIKI